MTTELPFLEAQLDAFTNSIWWSFDEKFGHTTRPKIHTNPTHVTATGDFLQRIWDSVPLRLILAFAIPYSLRYVTMIRNPFTVGLGLAGFCIAWPWIYQIFIYTRFLDPTRHLPGPKGHWLLGLGFGVPNEDVPTLKFATNCKLGFFQSDFANTLNPESCPGGIFAYVALGCRRIIPFTPNAISYFSNSRNYVKTEITRNVLRRLTGNGILVVDGNEHRRQRKILSPAFASPHIKNLIGHFWLKGCELRDYWEKNALNSDPKKGYEVFNTLTRTTLDIIGLAGFGYDFGALKDENNSVAQAYFTIFDNSPETLFATLMMALYPMLERLPFLWIKRSNDAKAIIIDAAFQLILSKTAEGRDDERDILGCMLQENRRLESLGEKGLSEEEMIYQILTFLGAGHETTSTALGWALYELSEHPEVQTRLRKEIHSVLGKSFDPHRPPTNDKLDQLKYLNNVCREVLRIDPPGIIDLTMSLTIAPITARQAVADDIYEGVRIPKDSIIHFPHLVMNMNTEIWGPDAAEFRPERWDGLKDVPNTHFMTFQHGIRACIGRKFAETEMKVLLAVLVGSFKFTKVPGWKVEKYSLITMRAKNGVYLHISRAE